jgi:transcriptional/translational regulatory protein YebC/TACO1
LMQVAAAAEQSGLTLESAQFEWIPNMPIDVSEEVGTQTETLIEALEEHDDVSQVYSNMN